MSDQIKTTYKGVDITYSEHGDIWDCEHVTKKYQHESLSKVKDRIDAWIKAENTFERFTALRISTASYGKQKFGNVVTVTSRTEDGDLWVTEDGDRSKIDKRYIDSHIVADTSENRARVGIVLAKREEIGLLERQVKAVIDAMERVTIGGEA